MVASEYEAMIYPNPKKPHMNTLEQNKRNFIIMILLLVVTIFAAKTLHDFTVVDSDQTKTALATKK